MKPLIPMDNYGVFVDKYDTARVDSRYVAQFFEKEHRNVIRDIRELDCSENFRLLNFEQSSYINEQGKKQPCYIMTRDGFVFLAIDLLEVLQKVDIGLLVSVPDYHERKRHLEWYAAKIRKEC